TSAVIAAGMGHSRMKRRRANGPALCRPLACRLRWKSAEEDDQRDEKTEEAGRLGKSKADQQVRELPRSSRRIAQGARQIVAEDVADADAGADERGAGEAGADELCCLGIHECLLVFQVA